MGECGVSKGLVGACGRSVLSPRGVRGPWEECGVSKLVQGL